MTERVCRGSNDPIFTTEGSSELGMLMRDKDYTVARIRFFLEKLDKEQDPLNIEAYFDQIQELSASEFQSFYEFNARLSE